MNKFQDDYFESFFFYWDNYIIYPIRRIKYGLKNLWKWRKIIWNDRWCDYDYLLAIIYFKLVDMEKHWGVCTFTADDQEVKRILKQMIEDLEWLMAGHEGDMPISLYKKEHEKRANRFFDTFKNNYQRFWD